MDSEARDQGGIHVLMEMQQNSTCCTSTFQGWLGGRCPSTQVGVRWRHSCFCCRPIYSRLVGRARYIRNLHDSTIVLSHVS